MTQPVLHPHPVAGNLSSNLLRSLKSFLTGENPYRQGFFVLLGPLVALYMTTQLDLVPGNPVVTRAAAVAVWMGLWWLTEAVPLAVTSLLPMVLFPMLQVETGKQVAPLYMNSIIFLFFGAFVIAIAMERWRLNKRIALAIIHAIGLSPTRLMLGFFAATAFLSMWLNNMAVTMMMVPTALAILQKLDDLDDPVQQAASKKLGVGLLLGIAFSASIGGSATLVGTAPNLVFVKIFQISFPNAPEISFSQWMFFALPFAIAMVVAVWWILSLLYAPKGSELSVDPEIFEKERAELGPICYEERAVLIIACLAAGLWITRSDIVLGFMTIPGWGSLFNGLAADGNPLKFVDDGTVAMIAAMLLFLVPSKEQGAGNLMRWEDLQKLPWDVIFLIGGGFALASGMVSSGLSEWIGAQLGAVQGMPPLMIVLVVSALVVAMTTLLSNTATSQMVLPVLASVAVAIQVNPLLLMIPTTVIASCAFILPVATPPNAVVYGTRRVSIAQMAYAGVFLNILSIALLIGMIFLLGPLVFGIDVNHAPSWVSF
ncbi:MAG: SLC13 family permease [Vampirovibrio sp.]|nr:SLC13 family permease [Vampirovibrio sp.]